MDDKKTAPVNLLLFKQAVRDAYYIQGQVENANRKFETAFRVWERIEEAKAEASRVYKKAYRLNLISCAWWIFSAAMWVLR